MRLQIFLKLAHDTARQFVQALAVYTQEHVRVWYLQVVEERSLQGGIVFPTGIHQLILGFLRASDGTNERCHLDEVRPRTSYNTDSFQCVRFLF